MIRYTPRNIIPYCKELNSLTGSVLASILLAQLNYWFQRYPNGFYKFLEPSNHPAYRPGSSWTEELGMTVAEFRTAFDTIGHRYTSKTKYAQAEQSGEDKFLGRYFASFIDKRQNMTFYVRNHSLLDQKLAVLIQKEKESAARDADYQSPVNAQIADQETHNPEINEMQNSDLQGMQSPDLVYTETTLQIIKDNYIPDKPSPDVPPQPNLISNVGNVVGSSWFSDLVLPKLNDKELSALKVLLNECPGEDRQSVCDELEGLRRAGKIQSSAVGLAKCLVKAVIRGDFVQSAGLSIEIERDKQAAIALSLAAVQAQHEAETSMSVSNIQSGVNPREAFDSALSQLKRSHPKGLQH